MSGAQASNAVQSAQEPNAPQGARLFADHCAACHEGSDPRVPSVAALRERSPESLVDALTVGNESGPAIAGGMVFLNSGYGALGGRPGNVLLAFGLK